MADFANCDSHCVIYCLKVNVCTNLQYINVGSKEQNKTFRIYYVINGVYILFYFILFYFIFVFQTVTKR